MRKTAVLLAFVLTSAIFAIPAQAHRGHSRPQITRFEFVDPPLKAGTLERLIVIAHDPDSWISEIQVQWKDDDQSGGSSSRTPTAFKIPNSNDPGRGRS